LLRGSGPDTKNKEQFMESCEQRSDEMFSSMRGWKLKMYQGPSNMVKMPDSYSGYPLLGEAVVDKVDVRDVAGFKALIPNTPNENFAWVYGGTLTIQTAGNYNLCTKSDDGSFLFVDDRKVVDNDGLHGPQQKCGTLTLPAGQHSVVAVGFQHGGGAFMQVTYKGPDTGNQDKFMESTLRRDSDQWSGGTGWAMTILKGPGGMTTIPTIDSRFEKLGSGAMQTVDIRSDGQFRDRVLRTPGGDYLWIIGGTLDIATSGVCMLYYLRDLS
jgi:hypothetical protein